MSIFRKNPYQSKFKLPSWLLIPLGITGFVGLSGFVSLVSPLLPTGSAQAATCTQTLSPGANVASAVSAAPGGAVICLNSGSYGAVTLSNVSKTNDVTIQSASGNGASLSANIQQSNHIRLENLTLTGLQIDTNQQGGTKNASVVNNRFTGQAVINTGNNSNTNILLDRNTFDGISVCTNCYEGRLQIIANPWSSLPSGVKITNNHFGGAGESDGIQNGANGVQIGPGNVFEGIRQGSYSRHVDSIQLYGSSNTTVTGNYFVNNDVIIMAPDGGNTEVFTNNTFVGSNNYRPSIQFGSHKNDVFKHNTVVNVDLQLNKKTERTDTSSNAVVQDNIFVNSSINTLDGNRTPSCTNCTISHNLFNSSGSASGSNNVIGIPQFVGGSAPTSWAGYQLSSGSPGYRAALDGADMGTTVYSPGSSTVTPSPVPTSTSSPTPAPTPIAGAQSLFTTQTPQIPSASDGASVNYELGMKFTANTSGQLRAIRFYKAANESGTHIGKIYNSGGQLLAQVTFTNETPSGWQQQALTTPLNITANTTYVVTVNTGNTYYVATEYGLSSQISNQNLQTVVGSNGVYGTVGSIPTQSWHDANYFRDVVFVASGTASPSPSPISTGTATPLPTATASPSPTPTSPGTLPAPSNLVVGRLTSTLVRLNWNDNTVNETGYVVERRVGTSTTGTFTEISTKAAGVTSHRDYNVTRGMTYCYRVKAIRGTSNSAYSNTVCAKVP